MAEPRVSYLVVYEMKVYELDDVDATNSMKVLEAELLKLSVQMRRWD